MGAARTELPSQLPFHSMPLSECLFALQGLSSPAAVFQLTHKLETALGVSADGTAAVPATTQDAQPAQAAADAAAPTLPTIQESVSARFSALRLPSGVVLTSV